MPQPGDARAELQAPGHEPESRRQGARAHQAARREAPGAAHRLRADDPRARRSRRREGRLHARPLGARRRVRLEDRARDGLPEGLHRARLHRRAAARRRQDRRARLGDHEAGPPHPGGVRRDQAAPGDRREDPRAGRLPVRRDALRAPPPRVVRRLRPRLPGPPARRRDPAALAHHPGRRHRRGDDERPAVPQGAAARRGLHGAPRSTRAASSTRSASTPSCACSSREGEGFIRKDQKFDIYAFIEG